MGDVNWDQLTWRVKFQKIYDKNWRKLSNASISNLVNWHQLTPIIVMIENLKIMIQVFILRKWRESSFFSKILFESHNLSWDHEIFHGIQREYFEYKGIFPQCSLTENQRLTKYFHLWILDGRLQYKRKFTCIKKLEASFSQACRIEGLSQACRRIVKS